MMKKTVTIFRYPVSGANYDIIEARYRGVTLNWYKDGRQESAQEKYAGDESIERIKQQAKRLGFTHAKFFGWYGKLAPKDGTL
jgi:hypothetical protein